LKENELSENSVIQYYLTTASDNKKYPTTFYAALNYVDNYITLSTRRRRWR
jgi:hypothetical protein